ncbi:MAG: hypothetical protein GY725_10190 [bacterium]|nr:hypothetical protein [bacterium]
MSGDDRKLFGRFHGLVLLALAFFLTSIAGGFIASVYQYRAWEFRNQASRLAADRSVATSIFEEISSLMDKRLFRMRRYLWRLKREEFDAQRIENRRDLYQEVLVQRNESLNRNLAMVQQYFGDTIRIEYEEFINKEFVMLAERLDLVYKARKEGRQVPAEELEELEGRIGKLSGVVYKLNLRMLENIQKGQIGLKKTKITIRRKPRGLE